MTWVILKRTFWALDGPYKIVLPSRNLIAALRKVRVGRS